MDPYLRKKDWLRGPGRSGRVPCEARNRYGAVAFAPFALCGCGHRAAGLGPRRFREEAAYGVAGQRVGRGEIGGRCSCGLVVHAAGGAYPVFIERWRVPVVARRLRGCALCFFSCSSLPLRFAYSWLPRGSFCLRYRSVALGASVGEQNGSSPGSSWSATASSPSSGRVTGGRCARARRLRHIAPVAQRLSRAWGRSSGSERSTRNWYGPGESDCLIKTKHRVAGRPVQTRCDFCPVL